MIALVQINRGVEQRVEKRPTMSDIKESGSIEECADAIMLLYRENYYDKNSLNDVMEIDIAKNKLTDYRPTIKVKRQKGGYIEIEDKR